ncbi:MAG: methylmalonyl-CoA mutase [Candidatus Schekmanbacteria bacterium RBG_13_48_7]|uniref:Methylmalonyl-CoA mutase n=1 Tax=Candidatus Schekmanbacteria bacterium RBG_13_48_7 TaxID=1817878 RepID=A0A1F7RNB5_9BACT|nr:MAG: methylmalonyl-CoA mutase [Candidatus Schekmanbacteria bacterium RBG_13_48_7]
MTSKKNPVKILVAKPGLDGHDVGAKVVAHALRDAGFEVIYSGLHQSPKAIANIALQEDVQVIGLSILSGAHIPLCTKIIQELNQQNVHDRLLIVGGVIPEKDHEELFKLGVSKIFPNESKFDDIIQYIQEHTS